MASSTAVATTSLSRAFRFQCPQRNGSVPRCFLFSNGILCPEKLSIDQSDARRQVVVAAKKRKNNPDTHSFVPKPDEATGPFPEAVLLKKKTVEEDGKVLPEFADAEEEKLYELLTLQLESDLNAERMRHYEVVYLIHEDCLDEVQTVISKVQDFIREKKGRIWRLNSWGLRKLAYRIRKARNAHYILMNFELDAKFINDFKSMLDRDERIIRHLVMKQDRAITEDCPPPPEFHTLRAQQGMIGEDADVYSDGAEVEDWDDEMELEMAGQDEIGAEDDGVIVVDDGEDASWHSSRNMSSKVKVDKVAS